MTIKGNEIFYEFDPFEIANRKRQKGKVKQVKSEIKDYILEAVLDKVGSATSPVSGHGRFKGLSENYRKEKRKVARPIANLELSGDMLDSLEVVEGKDGKLKIRIKGRQSGKADGHCNHSGQSKLPTRRFIPSQNETFKKNIVQGIQQLIDEHYNDET